MVHVQGQSTLELYGIYFNFSCTSSRHSPLHVHVHVQQMQVCRFIASSSPVLPPSLPLLSSAPSIPPSPLFSLSLPPSLPPSLSPSPFLCSLRPSLPPLLPLPPSLPPSFSLYIPSLSLLHSLLVSDRCRLHPQWQGGAPWWAWQSTGTGLTPTDV